MPRIRVPTRYPGRCPPPVRPSSGFRPLPFPNDLEEDFPSSIDRNWLRGELPESLLPQEPEDLS